MGNDPKINLILRDILRATPEQAKAMLTDPSFLSFAATEPQLFRLASAKAGILPVGSLPADEQVLLKRGGAKLKREQALKPAVKKLAQALTDALGALDSDLVEPMSPFVKRNALNALAFSARRQYMWGAIMGDAARDRAHRLRNDDRNLESPMMGSEDFGASTLLKQEALARFHNLQCEQYELLLKAAALAWEDADKEMRAAAHAAANVESKPYLDPVCETADRVADFRPDVDISPEAIERFRAQNDQRRAQQRKEERAADNAAAALEREFTLSILK